MARVTIDVERVLDLANNLLANPDNAVDRKVGVCVLLERVLHETGNYAGYMYRNLSDTHHPCMGDSVWLDEDEWDRMYLHSNALKKPRSKRCGV